MPKKTIFLLLFICVSIKLKAQTANAVYEQYLDFNYARLEDDQPKALTLGEAILPNAALLPAKSRVSFYNGLAKTYEDSGQAEKATTYYQIVEKAEPDFYVVHRALGYLYQAAAEKLFLQINAATDKAVKDGLTTQYNATVRKALPHLEKAQACDPSDDTLLLIKTLYNSINDETGLKGLDGRLNALGKKCIDILSDQ